MSKKLSFNEAAKVMRAARLEPIEDYPGNKLPWKCKCLQCGKIVAPSLGAVRNNGGGCKDCGLRKSAKSRRTDENKAISVMKKSGVKPLEPYTNSQKPWLCRCVKCKKEVSPSYGNVLGGHAACVYCSRKKIHPDDAIKIMLKSKLKPIGKYPGSNKPWKSIHITCGETVEPRLDGIIQGQGGCLKCGYKENQRKQLGDGDEARLFFLSKGFKPLEAYPGSNRPWRSKCLKCGFIVNPYYGRVKNGIGCGVCSQKIVVPEEAIKVMLKADLKPLEKFPGSKKKWLCMCLKCKREVTPVYGNVNQGDGGCKYCGGHFVEPEAAVMLMKSQGLIPQTPYKNSGTKWHCVCSKCRRDVYPNYNQIQQGQSGCAYCARRKVDPREARNIMIKAGVTPLVKFPGARNPWKSKCNKCGIVVNPLYSPIANQGYSPCVYCAGKKVDPKTAFQLMLNAGLTPLEQYKRADTRWRCTCNKCGKIVTPTYTSIRIGQGGCKFCTNKGLDYNAPSFLYLMTHQEFRSHKVGIGNYKTRNNRIDVHKKTGWILIQNIDFQTGEEAFQVEQETLVWLREVKKLGIYLSKSEMPQGGETETVDASEIDLPTIWAKVEEFSKKSKKGN
jgi:hypothetical protein